MRPTTAPTTGNKICIFFKKGDEKNRTSVCFLLVTPHSTTFSETVETLDTLGTLGTLETLGALERLK